MISRTSSRKLLQLFYRDSVDDDVLQVEQQRIEAERTRARRWITSATHETEEAETAFDEALAIIQGCHAPYLVADPELRRLMNQAIFTRLLVRADILEGEEAPLIEHIHRLRGSKAPVCTTVPRNGQDPLSSGGLGSNVDQMVLLGGQLYNPSSSLERVLSAPAPDRRSAAAPAAQPPTGRLGNGAVQRAVVKALTAGDRPMKVADVQTAVEKLLRKPVSRNSIYWCLSTGVQGSTPRFERVSLGCYRLLH